MTERFINHLPKVFVGALLLSYVVHFFIVGLVFETLLDPVFRFATYVLYAAAASGILAANIILCWWEMKRGKLPSMWLVCVMYATGCFALTLFGITGILGITLFFPEFENSRALSRLGAALVGGGLAGDLVAAVAFFVGMKRGLLSRRIHPWVWRR